MERCAAAASTPPWRVDRGNRSRIERVESGVKHLAVALLLAVGLSGCVGGQSTPAPRNTGTHLGPTGRLQIGVHLLPGRCALGARSTRCRDATATTRHYTLRCGPAGGDAPNPRAACRAIRDYLARRDQLGGCVGVLVGPGSTAVLSGTFAHRPFQLTLTAGYSWCGQPPALLRDFWVLSTFPCSTLVLRSGGRYPDWPNATGCTIDAA